MEGQETCPEDVVRSQLRPGTAQPALLCSQVQGGRLFLTVRLLSPIFR